MKNLNELDEYRCVDLWVLAAYGSVGDDTCGVFILPSPIDRKPLCVIASSGNDKFPWEHVSVSRKKRIPTWSEMEFIKRKFFKDDETAMQLHVPPAEHVNCHPNCLHLWRPTYCEIPRPPSIMVGLHNYISRKAKKHVRRIRNSHGTD